MNTNSNKVSSLEAEIECLRDEIRSLKLDQRAKDQELDAASQELNDTRQGLQNLQQIGIDVRMRYIETHRMRMGLPPSTNGKEIRKSGDRAAHRGRPVVDAWLYQTGQRKDVKVYEDLYGVPFATLMKWKEIPEMVEVCGFYASLKSDSGMTARYEELFRGLVEAAAVYDGMEELARAFEEKALKGRFAELQDCYDAIIAANPPRFRGNQLLSP